MEKNYSVLDGDFPLDEVREILSKLSERGRRPHFVFSRRNWRGVRIEFVETGLHMTAVCPQIEMGKSCVAADPRVRLLANDTGNGIVIPFSHIGIQDDNSIIFTLIEGVFALPRNPPLPRKIRPAHLVKITQLRYQGP